MPERFRRVLGTRHVPLLLGSSLLARLPYGILGLSLILFVHQETGSFAAAGVVSAAYAVSAGLSLPVLGRLVDRIGQRPILLTAAAVHGAANVALVALGLAGAGTLVLCLASGVAGASVPPISPALRGIWPGVLGDEEDALRAALALDAIVLEAVFIGGPLLTAAMVALASPQAALLTGAAFAVAGTVAFASTPPSRAWRGTARAAGRLGPLASPGLRTLLIAAVPIGFSLGALEVALPAFGVEQGSPSLGGVAIAVFALGSMAGGVWYGARAPSRVREMYLALSVVLPLGLALLTLGSSPAGVLLLAPLAGAVLAPLTAAENELAGHVAPAGTLTEAYAWIITATVIGAGLGSAVAGALAEGHGWHAGLLVGAAAGLVGAAAALVRRRTLVRPAAAA